MYTTNRIVQACNKAGVGLLLGKGWEIIKSKKLVRA